MQIRHPLRARSSSKMSSQAVCTDPKAATLVSPVSRAASSLMTRTSKETARDSSAKTGHARSVRLPGNRNTGWRGSPAAPSRSYRLGSPESPNRPRSRRLSTCHAKTRESESVPRPPSTIRFAAAATRRLRAYRRSLAVPIPDYPRTAPFGVFLPSFSR